MNNLLSLQPNIIIGDHYEAVLSLDAWKGFQSRQGAYTSKDHEGASDGTVKAFVQGKSVDYVQTSTPEQINAIRYLSENAEKIKTVLLTALLNELPGLKEIYEELIPEIKSIDDFKNYIGLSIVHIMDSDKDGFAYTGYELGCDWDEEHGVGVMMHKDRVLSIGQASTAFDDWVCYEDNGTEKMMSEKFEKESEGLKKIVKKPWWKFW